MSCPWCFAPNPGAAEFGGCKACGRSAVPVPAVPAWPAELDEVEGLARRAQMRAGGVVTLSPKETLRLLAAARQLPAAEKALASLGEADGWTPLHDPSGVLTVTAGTTCLFAVRTRHSWKQFIDAITWGAETEPQWYGAEHGVELCNIIYWRPLPEPPKGKP